MFSKRFRRSLPILIGALFTLAGPAAAQPFSAPERAAMLEALGVDGAAARDDAELQARVLRHAAVEAGQRIRPAQVDHTWAIQPARRDLMAEFAAARQAGTLRAWLQALPPPHPQYRALAQARRRYAALVQQGGWGELPPGPPLRQGDRDPQAALLRTRLAAEGFAVAATEDPDLFDPALAAALTTFQQLRGLDVDGVLGPRSRAALNVGPDERLQQIDANLERWRWLPHALPAERIEVDIAGAEATYLRGGAPVLRMRVVVGDRQHHTPMFASELRTVVFNPPWNVPDSIARNEIWPKVRRDPGYLARNRFVVIEGRLRQLPGPKSALGVLKFDLPSPFGVYLHDTPSKSGFQRADRALSHGCMRLEKPRELAVALLGRQGWTPEGIEQAIAAGDTRRVDLSTPVPLYVVYWTAQVDGAGALILRPDIYGWDRDLTAALAAASAERRAALPRGDTDCAKAQA